MNEAHAIKLCLQYSDPRGFEFLVKQYRREAFYHALTFMGNQEDAADACQEAFTKAFAAIPRVKKLEYFYPWFYKILKNSCLNMLSRKKTAYKYYNNERKIKSDNRQKVQTPATIVETKDEKSQVWKILNSLNQEFKEILVMKYIQGYDYKEISKTLDIPRGTVMSRLYHARKAFRKRFIKLENDIKAGKEVTQ